MNAATTLAEILMQSIGITQEEVSQKVDLNKVRALVLGDTLMFKFDELPGTPVINFKAATQAPMSMTLLN